MFWRKVAFLAATIPISSVLALICEGLGIRGFFPLLTPGTVAAGLLPLRPQEGCCDLSPLGLIFLVDTLSWFVALTAAYAILRGLRGVFFVIAVPLSCVLS